MIPLAEAQAKNFSDSTRAELRAYAEELGIEGIPDNASAATLRKQVCNALGIAMEVDGRVAQTPTVRNTQGGDRVLPPYNLTPNGIWGGRRHRLSIPRPDGVKVGQAEPFWWNGKHPYYLAYDEVDAVPEPIYNIIATNKKRRVSAVKPQGGADGELTTKWDFDAVPINYYGVDPETKDRAGSLLEWYQARGSKWFNDLSDRQLMQVARMLEVPTQQHVGDKIPPRVFDIGEMRARVFEFLYSYADAEVEPNEAMIEADEKYIESLAAKVETKKAEKAAKATASA